MLIGNKIRHLRQNSGFTLEELSKKSGIALATLSRIENQKMIGTLESHQRISRAFGITLSQLFSGLEEDRASIDLHKENSQDIIVHANNKYSSEILTSGAVEKKMNPELIKIQPHAFTDTERLKVGSEMFIYVIDGSVQVSVGNEIYDLSKGESIYFNASPPHQIRNLSDLTASCLSVVSP